MGAKKKSERVATILVGVCGGIAAYKTVDLVSRLRKEGHDVRVAMSAAACEFVTPLTFAALSGQAVLTRNFPEADRESGDQLYPHLYPATQADVFVLMPATADMIGRIAQGLGDEIISTCALSLPPTCRRFFCPSMNVEMWEQSSVQESVRVLEERGWIRLGPESGPLACGMEGAGRLIEPDQVAERVSAALAKGCSWIGKKVLILSGPTREHLDPVRYIGNASSGRMGKALAEAAADRGAQVTLVTGPVPEALWPRRSGIRIVPVCSAGEMLEAARKPFVKCDIAFFAAAVADYQPVAYVETKIEKPAGQWSLNLQPTPDIAATLAADRKKKQRLIGFALQSGDGREAAREKLVRKGFDAIVLNAPDAMGADAATYTFISANGKEEAWGHLPKTACADKLCDACVDATRIS
jgi:phosphopantothenoylcysteine decarboxylase / phosphopantothenate---cysteine ligase